MGIRHSPITPYSPWTNGLVEVKNKNLGTHLRMILQNTPKWKTKSMCTINNSQPISALNVSPHILVFHSRPKNPLTLGLNLILNCNTKKLAFLKPDLNLQNTHFMSVVILIHVFVEKIPTVFPNDFSKWKLSCYNSIQ